MSGPNTFDPDDSGLVTSPFHQQQQLQPSKDETAQPSGDGVPEWLGDKLKALYSDVMTEPVPDELVSLLQQLEQRERDKR